ncbi:hypothetical protein DSO57_1014514 [Entomophthora muscae]|uniref:Uncharacterized protein n=1 Tax=Entomophthora muscae TaxID=34485 RepID=A0ACC2T5F9_9FUNG|nr:hypothetical protein DSO57_1014514 [Entomophthora muscae]
MLLKLLLLGACYGQDISEIFNIIASAAFNEILSQANTSNPAQLPRLNQTQVKVQVGTEEDARYYFSFATLAYCNSSVIHEWKCNSCHDMGPGWKAHDVIRDPILETQGVVAVNHQRKEIGISIRGSTSFTNQIQNALFELVMLNGFDQTIKGHLGFSSIARGLQTQLIQSVRSILEQRFTQDYSVTMVGHSMGELLPCSFHSTCNANTTSPGNESQSTPTAPQG